MPKLTDEQKFFGLVLVVFLAMKDIPVGQFANFLLQSCGVTQ